MTERQLEELKKRAASEKITIKEVEELREKAKSKVLTQEDCNLLEGKVIKRIINYAEYSTGSSSDNRDQLAILCADGTIWRGHIRGFLDDQEVCEVCIESRGDMNFEDTELYDIGLITHLELIKIEDALRRSRKEKSEVEERKEYERLKAKFEGAKK
jgi:hypothetical protein